MYRKIALAPSIFCHRNILSALTAREYGKRTDAIQLWVSTQHKKASNTPENWDRYRLNNGQTIEELRWLIRNSNVEIYRNVAIILANLSTVQHYLGPDSLGQRGTIKLIEGLAHIRDFEVNKCLVFVIGKLSTVQNNLTLLGTKAIIALLVTMSKFHDSPTPESISTALLHLSGNPQSPTHTLLQSADCINSINRLARIKNPVVRHTMKVVQLRMKPEGSFWVAIKLYYNRNPL